MKDIKPISYESKDVSCKDGYARIKSEGFTDEELKELYSTAPAKPTKRKRFPIPFNKILLALCYFFITSTMLFSVYGIFVSILNIVTAGFIGQFLPDYKLVLYLLPFKIDLLTYMPYWAWMSIFLAVFMLSLFLFGFIISGLNLKATLSSLHPRKVFAEFRIEFNYIFAIIVLLLSIIGGDVLAMQLTDDTFGRIGFSAMGFIIGIILSNFIISRSKKRKLEQESRDLDNSIADLKRRLEALKKEMDKKDIIDDET